MTRGQVVGEGLSFPGFDSGGKEGKRGDGGKRGGLSGWVETGGSLWSSATKTKPDSFMQTDEVRGRETQRKETGPFLLSPSYTLTC